MHDRAVYQCLRDHLYVYESLFPFGQCFLCAACRGADEKRQTVSGWDVLQHGALREIPQSYPDSDPGDGTGATDGSEKAPIGESIIAPDAEYYEIEIDLVQKVAKYENSAPGTPTDWEDYEFNSIKTVVKSDGLKFKPGYTYDFIFKVYGLEKITVTTVLKPWIWGENQEIPTE